jgi:hypothetical protein
MQKKLTWLLAALPYVAFMFGATLWLEVGMWYFDMGLDSPFDEAYRLWGSIIYAVCAFITLGFVNDLAHHRVGYNAYTRNPSKLWLVLALQAFFWFWYLPWFASRCHERKTTFARVALVVGERWLLMLAKLRPQYRPHAAAEADDIEYEDREPHKGRADN